MLIFVTATYDMANADQDKITLQAIKTLRKHKLSQGIPFMINSDILDPHQCFIEHPDGLTKIAEADAKGFDFVTLHEYSLEDSNRLRRKLNIT